MRAPPLPDDEAERLAAVHATGLLDTASEDRFDRITRLAARVLDVPIALVTLVDRDRQWFKSRQGLGTPETSRDVSFCGHAILGSTPMVVTDAAEDERFSDNPLVTGEPRIRFYVGRPLRTADGLNVGTLCLIDRKPRLLTPADLEALEDLAMLAEAEIHASAVRGSLLDARAQEARFRTLATFSPVGIFETDAVGRCLYTNQRWQEITGLSAEQALGDGWSAAIHPDDRARVFEEWTESARRGAEFASDFRFRRPSGESRWVSARAAAIRSDEGEILGWVGTDEDITDRREAAAQLAKLASTDPLTGAANARTLRSRLDEEIDRAKRYAQPFCLAMIDIDRFKTVNDRYGHAVGDAAIRHVVELMSRRVRRTDLIGRYGGDELCVIIPHTALEGAVRMLDSILDLVRTTPLPSAEHGPIALTLSAGVAAFAGHGDGESVMKAADDALYRAKSAGRDRVSR